MMDKQLQQQHQQMQHMQQQIAQPPNSQDIVKELEKVKADMQAACTERDRFQSQLEMLVQELEKSQVRNYFKIKNFMLFHLSVKW